ncbi:MAG: 4Fe-4S dicluster domain-containing protein [Dehalococcoidia bacterium]|nr:4Fe-4S dicluster domain-containing protein [Desulfobacterales bacterium]MDZ4246307.1 4Fe-4S dicluster domain-containing protein [Dehalococcoidia bacterium]
MTRWGMVIDLKRCVGCQTCTVACKIENFVPPGVFFTLVHDYEVGKYPTVQRHFMPTGCMHCKEPPCVEVCPTGASHQREDGIVLVDKDKCMGCRYCMLACPYSARYFNEDGGHGYFEAGPTPYEAFGAGRHENGTVIKCTFCAERIDEAQLLGLKVGVDRDATPACVGSCIANARYFGDLDDENSEVSQLIRARGGRLVQEELGTEPCIYYLMR